MFRGSRDGFSHSIFHEICDNQSRTITIVKVKGNNEILGGYNPIAWTSDDNFGITKNSFIFSFKDINNIENYILSRVIDEKNAIYNRSSYGPSFGHGDLRLYKYFFNEFKVSCEKTSYENPIRGTNDIRYVEEFEVFQIV